MPMGIANTSKEPDKPVITIQKKSNPAQVFTFNPFTGIYDFQVKRAQFAHRYLNTAGYFDIEIYDENGLGIYDELENGREITFWVGKSDATKKKRVLGQLLTPWVITESQDDAWLRLVGPEWGSNITNNRLLQNFIKQKLLSTGQPDPADNSTLVKNLYYDILTNPRWYPAQNLTIQQQGVTVDLNEIKIDGSLQVSEFGASMEYSEDVLKRLDNVAYGAIHEINPDKLFKAFVPKAVDSGIIIAYDHADSILNSWPSDKISLMVGRTEFGRSGEEYRKHLWAQGGSLAGRDPDLLKTTDGGFETLNGKAWAIKIPTMRFIEPQYIGAKLFRTGTVPANITIELREDKDGQPLGSKIRTIDFDKADINTMAAADFRYMDMTGEQLNSKQAYWLILYQNGDASNTPRWQRSGSTTPGVSRAFSTDNGATWTVENDSYQFTLDYWYIQPLRDNLPNDDNIIGPNAYYVEELVREPNLKDDVALSQLLEVHADRMFYEKHVFKGLVYSPEVPFENGQKVRVRVQNHPIKNFDYEDFIVAGIEYLFDGESDESDGALYYDVTCVRLDK